MILMRTSAVVLQALCTEASLAAVRRVYPQIYNSDEKLLVSPDQVLVTRDDFMTDLQGEALGGGAGGVAGW
jgi:SpoVK/Ycf46/Vps4 family AAA+-type ATPase